jgi:hypothetical protein
MNKATGRLDNKAIRILVTRRLSAEHPHFNRLKRKEKRRIAADACEAAKQAMKTGEMAVPKLTAEELLGLGKRPEGIMNLDEMGRFIENHERTMLRFPSKTRKQHIKKTLLQIMDELLDDSLLDRLLAPSGMTPSMREWMPSRLLRIELLRTGLFPEWSVRKFCGYLGELEHKEERAFCNLPLHRKEMCDHSTLSTFRASLTFEMRVNLMVYMAHHFLASGRLGDRVLHTMDSTDVAEPVNTCPLAKIEMPDGSFIRFYADLSCDCGSRRNKRDKSKMFVGYRIHTLCVADVESGIAFPLLSLTVAANHHDSQVLEPLLALARAVGVELKMLTADEAYADAEKQIALREEHGLLVVTPSKSKATVPGNVDAETGNVFIDGACETPMRWDGYDKEDGGHVFVCQDDACPRAALCAKERIIPMDTGLFGPIPRCVPEACEAVGIRKIAERPFNLLKHMDGLEPCRMKTHATVSAQAVFSQMTGLFKVMAGLRAVPKYADRQRQEVLHFAANG